MLNLLQYTTGNVPFKDKESTSNLFAEVHSLTDANEATGFISKLNAMLQSPDKKSKNEGLVWLLQFLNVCSNDKYDVHSFSWFMLAIKILTNSDCTYNVQLSYSIIKSIIKRGLKSPTDECGAVTQVIQIILKTSCESELPYSINCLAALIEKMPAHCKPHRENIEKFLCSRFDSADSDEIEAVALCYSLLPRVGGKQDRKLWNDQFSKIVNTLAQFSREYFDISAIDYVEGERYNTAPPSQDSISAALWCYRNFHAIVLCGIKMLNSDIPSSVEIPGLKTISVICEVLKFSVESKQLSSLEEKCLMSVWMAIVKDVLMLLEALIVNCHDAMLNYKDSITEVLLYQLNQSVSTAKGLYCRSYVRSNVYRVVLATITKIDGNSLKKNEEDFLKFLVHDIEIAHGDAKDFVPFNKKNSLEENKMFLCESLFPDSYIMRRDNCLGALKVLSSFLCVRKEALPQTLPQRVMSLLVQVTMNTSYPLPYNDELCRKELYGLLLSMAVQTIQTRAVSFVPLSMALKIFERGMKDTSIEVSHLCIWASSICSSVVHSIKPTQPVPTEKPQKQIDLLLPSPIKMTSVRTISVSEVIPITLQNCTSSLSSNFVGNHLALQNEISRGFDEQDDINQDPNENHMDEDEELEEEEEHDNTMDSEEDEEVEEEEEEGSVVGEPVVGEPVENEPVEDEPIEEKSIEGESVENVLDEPLAPVSSPNAAKYHMQQKTEKQPVNDGHYLLQNGVSSSGEDERSPENEGKKRNLTKQSRDFYVESAAKRKRMDIEQKEREKEKS